MVDVDAYLKASVGNWIRAEHVKPGDRLEVLGEGEIDDTSFDKPYIVVSVKLTRTGEEFTARMGSKNVDRVANTLGLDTKGWVGNHMEVISIESYPGLGRKGMLLKGVKAAVETGLKFPAKFQAKAPSLGAVSLIRGFKEGIENGIPLSAADWKKYVREDLAKELLDLGLVVKDGESYRFTEKCREHLG